MKGCVTQRRVGLPLRGEGKTGRGQRWQRELGKLKLDGINLSAESNARPAAEKCEQWNRVYCLSKKSWSGAQGNEQ